MKRSAADAADTGPRTTTLPPSVVKRLAREHADVLSGKNRVSFAGVAPAVPEDLSRWRGWLQGPPGTPYEGGLFYVRMSVPAEYPFKPPGLQFETRVYHPNIDASGGVCVNILKTEWNPSQTLMSVMQVLYALLASPNPDDPLVPAAAKLYKTDRAAYDRVARDWTQRHARPTVAADAAAAAAEAAAGQAAGGALPPPPPPGAAGGGAASAGGGVEVAPKGRTSGSGGSSKSPRRASASASAVAAQSDLR